MRRLPSPNVQQRLTPATPIKNVTMDVSITFNYVRTLLKWRKVDPIAIKPMDIKINTSNLFMPL